MTEEALQELAMDSICSGIEPEDELFLLDGDDFVTETFNKKKVAMKIC